VYAVVILANVRALSVPYGTGLRIDDGVGVIDAR